MSIQQNMVMDSFFEHLKKASASVLFLDYDGTLAPFCIERDKAYPYPGVCALLEKILFSSRTHLVLISGRRPLDLISLLNLPTHPEIWGSHGWERCLPDGTCQIGKIDELCLKGLVEADAWIEEKGWISYIEQKPACMALHVRGMDKNKAVQILQEAKEKWLVLAKETGLQLLAFDGGLELRAPGRNKGTAVETVLSEVGPQTQVAYLGDDLTDEDAFKVIKKNGLAILVRSDFRNTSADIWLKPPEELLEFLARWADAVQA